MIFFVKIGLVAGEGEHWPVIVAITRPFSLCTGQIARGRLATGGRRRQQPGAPHHGPRRPRPHPHQGQAQPGHQAGRVSSSRSFHWYLYKMLTPEKGAHVKK